MPLSRRTFRVSAAALATALGLPGRLPARGRSAGSTRQGIAALSGTEFDLDIAATPVDIDGRRGKALTINGSLPAPLLRWREGDTLTLRVHNHLEAATSIHWHGILLPFQMDGVPGVSFPGIGAGETFEYRFKLEQNGTYWYHSHSGLQEQLGHYGPSCSCSPEWL